MTRPHYDIGNIQPIDYMSDQMSKEQFEGFLRGNVMKYISRYPHKGGIDDLEKAQWYLQRLIKEKKRCTNPYSCRFGYCVNPLCKGIFWEKENDK